tara:strand:- start:1907 stop:2044 length:138 start_codon:yes stop_codon:yes gene_type:complete
MKKTIFTENKSFTDVIIEGFIFAIGSGTALTIIAAFVIITLNFLR